MREPVDPIEALAPSDQDQVTWLVPGRIQLEPGGTAIEAPGGNRPIEVALIDEQGSKVRVALQLDHVRFSVWSDRSRLMAVIGSRTKIAAAPGGSGPSTMTVELAKGTKIRRLARKDRWTQIRYIGGVSLEGWVLEESLVASLPRADHRRVGFLGGRRTLMTSPGTVIRAEPK